MKENIKKIINFYFNDDWQKIILFFSLGVLAWYFIFYFINDRHYTHFIIRFTFIYKVYSVILAYIALKPIYIFIKNNKIVTNIYKYSEQETYYEDRNAFQIIRAISISLIFLFIKIAFYFFCFIAWVKISYWVIDLNKYMAMKYYDLPHYIAFPCSYYDYGNYNADEYRNLSPEQQKELEEYYGFNKDINRFYGRTISGYCNPPEREYADNW